MFTPSTPMATEISCQMHNELITDDLKPAKDAAIYEYLDYYTTAMI